MERYNTERCFCDLSISIVRAVSRQFCWIKCYWHFHWITEQLGLHTWDSGVWLKSYFRSHMRIWYQGGLNFFTGKGQLENARSKKEMVRIWMPLWRLWISTDLRTVSAQRDQNSKDNLNIQLLRKEHEKRQRVVCYCYFGPHGTSEVLSTFSLTRLSDLPHLSCLISPFLFLSDSDYHPIYGSFIRWVKITSKLLSLQHALELKVICHLWFVTDPKGNGAMHQAQQMKEKKNQREGRYRPFCFSKVSRPHWQNHIFIWEILLLLFFSLVENA